MAKKGMKKMLKRITVPKILPVRKKKHTKWISVPSPGKHNRNESISLMVLLRDALGITTDAHEAKRIVKRGMVKVDGKVITDERFAIGLMDIIEINDTKKKYYYQMLMLENGLRPVEIDELSAEIKLKKITTKRTLKGKKIQIGFHDGTTMLADNKYVVSDSIAYNLKSKQVDNHIKFQNGCYVYIIKGKHMGRIMKLENEIKTVGSHETEALVSDSQGNKYITLKNYLFPIDEKHVERFAKIMKT